jgi:hypothetical protein
MNGEVVSATAFEVVCDGPEGCIRLSGEALTEFRAIQNGQDKITVQRRRHIERYMRAFCENAQHWKMLSDEKFKKEDDFPDGRGGTVAVFAFKAWQWRLYGAVMAVGNKKTFVGVRADTEKKQTKSDQALMARAAKDIGQLAEHRAKRGDRNG